MARLVPVADIEAPTGRDVLAAWRTLPHLVEDEADAFAADIESGGTGQVCFGVWRGCLRLTAYSDEPIRIVAVTASELLHGWERAPAGKRRDNRMRFVEGLFKVLPTVEFCLDCARVHAHLWARLEEQGILIGAHDLLIATTCVLEGDSIATLNKKEFSRIAELELADCRLPKMGYCALILVSSMFFTLFETAY